MKDWQLMAVASSVSFTIPSMIRGYHVYQSIWTPEDGELLSCHREMSNMYMIHVSSLHVVLIEIPRPYARNLGHTNISPRCFPQNNEIFTPRNFLPLRYVDM